MRAILIDPAAKAVTEVEHDGADAVASIYRLLMRQSFSVIALAGRDIMYLDDEWMLHEGERPGFTWGDNPQPIVGRALIVSTDELGGDAPASMQLDHARASVRFMPEGLLVTGAVTVRGQSYSPVLGAAQAPASRTRVVFTPPAVEG